MINIRTYVIGRKKLDDTKVFKKAKNLFIKLKTDPGTVIFAEELLDVRLLKKLKKSKLVDSKSIFNEDKAPTRADYVEKRNCSFNPI